MNGTTRRVNCGRIGSVGMWVALAVVAGVAGGAFGQEWPVTGPAMIVDLDTGYYNTGATSFTPTSIGTIYRASVTGNYELWVTDGTNAGTRRLGTDGPVPAYDWNSSVVDLGGRVVFYSTGILADAHPGLWSTDGTPSGTYPIPGATLHSGGVFYGQTAHKGSAYFCSPIDGLFRTDGSAAASRKYLLRTRVNDVASFAGSLYVIDGSSVNVFDPESEAVTKIADTGGYWLVILGDKLMWYAADKRLWVSDGTPGNAHAISPVGVMDVASVYARRPAVNGARAIFRTDTQTWVTDGTESGTHKILDFVLDVDSVGDAWYGISSYGVRPKPLYRTDGTTEGTVAVGVTIESLIYPVPPSQSSLQCPRFVAYNGKTYFRGYDAEHGIELWSTDGTPEGLARVTDLVPGPGDGGIGQLSLCQRGLLVTAFADNGREQLDVLSGGTLEVLDAAYDHSRNRSSGASPIAPAGAGVIMSNSFPGGVRVGVFDSLSHTVTPITDFQPPLEPDGQFSVYYLQPFPVQSSGDRLVSATATGYGTELWMYRQAQRRFELVKDLSPGTASTTLLGTAYSAGVHYFVVRQNGADVLYRTDGTDAGTQALLSFTVGSDGVGIMDLAGLDSGVFFRAHADGLGIVVWTCDGTTAGSHPLSGVISGSTSAGDPPATLNGKIYFLGHNYNSLNRLYRMNADMTGLEFLNVPGVDAAYGPTPKNLTTAMGSVFFSGRAAGGVWRLYRANPDGSVVGPFGDANASGVQCVPGNSKVLLSAPPLAGGTARLCVTDGTDAGTRPVLTGDGLTLTSASFLVNTPAGSLWRASAVGWDAIFWLIDESTAIARALPRADASALPLKYSGPAILNHSKVFLLSGDSFTGYEPFVIDLCPADLNNDGVADLTDFYAFFQGWDQGQDSADRNRDGVIDLLDFFWFFGSFDLGCPG